VNFGNVLVLSPHVDDGETGAGGTIAKLIESGSRVTCLAFWGEGTLKEEFENSMNVLGVEDFRVLGFERRVMNAQRQHMLNLLYAYNSKNDVNLVFTPATSDTHQDHQTVTNEAIRAFTKCSILGYETPRNNACFNKTLFVRLKRRHVKAKVEAVASVASVSKIAFAWLTCEALVLPMQVAPGKLALVDMVPVLLLDSLTSRSIEFPPAQLAIPQVNTILS